MNREEKRVEIEFLGKAFKATQIALCADYRGLDVAEVTAFRRELNKNGANARVVKNTLARICAEKAYSDADPEQLRKFMALFEGPSMVIFSENDPVAPAKVIAAFAKDHEKLKIKGAWLDGAFVDQNGVQTLSKMPGKAETLAKLLALMVAPATQLVRLMNTPGTQIARVIDAQRQNLEKKAA